MDRDDFCVSRFCVNQGDGRIFLPMLGGANLKFPQIYANLDTQISSLVIDSLAALFHGEWLKNKCGVENNTEIAWRSRRDRTDAAHKECKKEGKKDGRLERDWTTQYSV